MPFISSEGKGSLISEDIFNLVVCNPQMNEQNHFLLRWLKFEKQRKVLSFIFLRIVENALWDKAAFTISLLLGSCYFIHRYAFCGTFSVGKCMYVERNKEKLCKAKTKNTADKDARYR